MKEMEERRSRLTASDFHPGVLHLFDQYVHGLIDRRAFLERAARFTVAGGSAIALLEALSPRFAEAQQISPQDKRLHAAARLSSETGKGDRQAAHRVGGA
jgi:carboxymethylenebutenolidase